jgi:hypothetical protein
MSSTLQPAGSIAAPLQPGTDPLTEATVSSLFNTSGNVLSEMAQGQEFQAQQVEDTGQAQEYSEEEAGGLAEAGAYTAAGKVAQQNAVLALAGTQVEQYQAGLEAQQTIGSQRAAVAGAGFADSGTALDLLSMSTRQASIQQQLIGTQGNLTAGGFLEEQAASGAEVDAALTAATAAGTASTTATAAAGSAGQMASEAYGQSAVSQTNAMNEINYLENDIAAQAKVQGLPQQTVQNNMTLAELQNLSTETMGISPSNPIPSTAGIVPLPSEQAILAGAQTPQSTNPYLNGTYLNGLKGLAGTNVPGGVSTVPIPGGSV